MKGRDLALRQRFVRVPARVRDQFACLWSGASAGEAHRARHPAGPQRPGAAVGCAGRMQTASERPA